MFDKIYKKQILIKNNKNQIFTIFLENANTFEMGPDWTARERDPRGGGGGWGGWVPALSLVQLYHITVTGTFFVAWTHKKRRRKKLPCQLTTRIVWFLIQSSVWCELYKVWIFYFIMYLFIIYLLSNKKIKF